MHFSTVAESFAWLEGFANFEKRAAEPGEYRLDRMHAMLAAFGNPQNACPAIHIAGSKGKGSTARFCASILQQAGYQVGIYASPHLIDYRERIGSASGFYADETYCSAISGLFEWVQSVETDPQWLYGVPTTFELLTLAAYMIFQTEKSQWIVVETGLGGRLDATNLMQSRACLITALELEHTDILGDTLALIAAEKAGIFRANALLFTQHQKTEGMAVLRQKAEQLGAKLFVVEKAKHDGAASDDRRASAEPARTDETDPSICKSLSISIPLARYVATTGSAHSLQIDTTLAVAGSFQLDNAALAAHCIAGLWARNDLPEIGTMSGLKSAIEDGISAASIPGRLERYVRHRKNVTDEIWIDVSHTPVSVDLAREAFNPQNGDILLFGSVSGKRHNEMAAVLAPAFSVIIISTPGTFKKSSPAEVYTSFYALNEKTELILDVDTAFDKLLDYLEAHSQNRPRALVCGSFYMAGAIVTKLDAAGFSKEDPCR